MTRLDDLPTTFPPSHDAVHIPRLLNFVQCSPPPVPPMESHIRLHAVETHDEPESKFNDQALEELAQTPDDPSRALATHRLLRLRFLDERADRLTELMERAWPRTFFVRLAVAEREALAGRWLGDDLEAEAPSPEAREHVLHVRAVACLRGGRLDEVASCLEGRATPGPCRLDGLLVLGRTLRAELAGEPPTADEMKRPCLANLVRRIFAADRAVAVGHRQHAIRLLDQAWIREVCEMQSMARLAELYLDAGTSDGPADEFRASTLLADFIDLQVPTRQAVNLWLADRTWPAQRIEALLSTTKARLKAPSWLRHHAVNMSDGHTP